MKGNKKMLFVNKYNLTYYNDSEGENQKVSGIVLAETYHEAVELLEKYYGEKDLISIDFLEGYECGYGCVIPDDELAEIGYERRSW